MRSFSFSGLAFSAFAVGILAGCSGSAGSAARPFPLGASSDKSGIALAPRRLSVAAFSGRLTNTGRGVPRIHTDGGTTVWVTDAGNNAVYECMEDCKPTGSLDPGSGSWSLPQGIAADAKGNVYIADTDNSRIVVLNKKGAQLAILSDPGQYPAGVSVASDGLVGVTNILGVSGPANIVFYANGSTTPTSTATGLLGAYYFGGFDEKGNFYNDGFDADGTVHIGVVRKGSSNDVDTGITGTAFPGGVEIDKGGNELNVLDQSGLCVRVYELTAGYPLTATVSLTGASDPVTFGFKKGGSTIWVADVGAGVANEYKYPAGGSPLDEYTGFSEPIGAVAVPRGQY